MKKVVYFFLVFVLLGVLVFPGGEQEAPSSTTISISIPEHWQLIEPLLTDQREKAPSRRLWMYDIVKNFEEKYPDIKLELESVPWDKITETFVNKSVAGDPPDIQTLANGSQYVFARAGLLHPLDNFEYEWNDFGDNLFENNMKVDGKIYMMPAYIFAHVLHYNDEMLKNAGYTRPPKTLDELVEYAKKMTIDTNNDGEPDVWGFGLPSSPIHPPFVFQNWETLVWLFGGKVAEDGKALLNTPEARKATQFYVDLVRKHKVSPESVTSWDKEYMSKWYRAEKLAMTFRGPEEYPPSLDALGSKAKIASIPVVNSGDPDSAWMELFGWVMSAKAGQDPRKREACWLFLKEIVSDESYLLMAEHQRGLPARKSISDHPIFQSDKVFEFQAEYTAKAGRADPEIDGWELWKDIVSKTIQSAVLGLDTVDNLLENAQKEYDRGVSR